MYMTDYTQVWSGFVATVRSLSKDLLSDPAVPVDHIAFTIDAPIWTSSPHSQKPACGTAYIQADGCLCTSPDRSLVMVGSADGSVTLLPGNLAFKGGDSVPVVVHDMWSGKQQHEWPKSVADTGSSHSTAPSGSSGRCEAVKHVCMSLPSIDTYNGMARCTS